MPDLSPRAGRDFLSTCGWQGAHIGQSILRINKSENSTRQCGVQTFWKQKTSVNCFGRQSPMQEDRAPGQKKLVSTALLSISFCVGGNSQLNRSYVPSSCESCTWRKNLRCLQVEGRYHGLIRSLTASQGSDFRSGSPTEVRCNVRHVCFHPHFGQAVDATRGPSWAKGSRTNVTSITTHSVSRAWDQCHAMRLRSGLSVSNGFPNNDGSKSSMKNRSCARKPLPLPPSRLRGTIASAAICHVTAT